MHAIIEPVPAFGSPATILVIDNVGVALASSATLWWHLRAAPQGADLAPSRSLLLDGDAYAAWGTDDEYLYRWAAAQLGLTIVEIVPDAPAPAPPVGEPLPLTAPEPLAAM